MTWNPKSELVKRARNIATKQYPNGFNKKQLINCSKQVFDGFGITQVNKLEQKPVKTMEDVNNMGNAMAFIDGGYPVGMPGCYVVGINGDCGIDCPVFKEGGCKELGDNLEYVKLSKDLTDEEKNNILSLYE